MLRASGSRAVNHIEAPGSVNRDLSLQGGAKLYAVRTDGTVTAANKDQANDPSNALTSLKLV